MFSVVSETAMLTALLSFTGLYFAYYVVSLVLQLAYHLDISVFSIPLTEETNE